MRLCKKIIAVAIATQLAACGGGDDSDSDVGTTASISGKAADGYLTDAKACLDSNLNKLCDANEPSAMTGSAGEFTIQAEQSAIDTAPILIEAIAGKTVDLDDPNNTISDNYTLSAPAKSLFVSPISTLVQNEIELGSSQQEAIESISQKLGSTIDIAADYVKLSAEDSADSPEYERLHKTAQVLVDIQVKKAKELQTVSGVAHSDKMAVINAELEKQLDQIANKVDAAGDSFDSAAVADDVLPNMDITEENLQDKVDAIESEKNAVSSDMLALLKSVSIGNVMSDGPLLYHELLELQQEKTYGSMHDLRFTLMEYDGSYETLRPVTETPTNLLLTDAGWEVADDKIIGLQQTNGVDVLVTALPELSMQVSVKKMNVSNKSMLSFVGDDAKAWKGIVDESATFAPETYAYMLKTKPVQQRYVINTHPHWCTAEEWENRNKICNVIQTSNGSSMVDATSLASVTKDTADMQQQGTIGLGFGTSHRVVAEMLVDGTAHFYSIGYSDDTLTAIDSGTWSDQVILDQTIRVITAPPSVYRNLYNSNFSSDNKAYIAQVKGFLRAIEKRPNQASESIWFDQNVASQLDQAISQPLTMAQCLASLPDKGHIPQPNDYITYKTQETRVNPDGSDLVLNFEDETIRGGMADWPYVESGVVSPAYKDIPEIPLWTQNKVEIDSFTRKVDGKLVYEEKAYYSDVGYHGHQSWEYSQDSNGILNDTYMITPKTSLVANEARLINWPFILTQERVLYSDLDDAIATGKSYAQLPKNKLDFKVSYLGKEKIKIGEKEYNTCVLYEDYGSGYNKYWKTNIGSIKRESKENDWLRLKVSEMVSFGHRAP